MCYPEYFTDTSYHYINGKLNLLMKTIPQYQSNERVIALFLLGFESVCYHNAAGTGSVSHYQRRTTVKYSNEIVIGFGREFID